MTNMIVTLKRTAAVLILATLFMPLSKCTLTPPPEEKHQKPTVTISYAYSGYKWPSLGIVAAVFAFVWPLLFSIFGNVERKALIRITINIVELLLCLGSGFMILMITLGGELLYGAYIAVIAFTTYFVTTLIQLVSFVKKWRMGNQT